MFVYALGKGVRFGYFPPHYLTTRSAAEQGIQKQFVVADGWLLTLTSTVKAIGLGSGPDAGSYDYYVHSPVIENDPKGVGAFLLRAQRWKMSDRKPGRGKTVMLDAWYNSQQRQDASGHIVYFHYKWNDTPTPATGSSATSGTLRRGHKNSVLAADACESRRAQIYLIASPDIPVKTPVSHYVQPEDVKQTRRVGAARRRPRDS